MKNKVEIGNKQPNAISKTKKVENENKTLKWKRVFILLPDILLISEAYDFDEKPLID